MLEVKSAGFRKGCQAGVCERGHPVAVDNLQLCIEAPSCVAAPNLRRDYLARNWGGAFNGLSQEPTNKVQFSTELTDLIRKCVFLSSLKSVRIRPIMERLVFLNPVEFKISSADGRVERKRLRA